MRRCAACLELLAVLALIGSCATERSKVGDARKHDAESATSTSPARATETTWIQGDAYIPRGAVTRTDAAWRRRVAFIYPSTGNSIEPDTRASLSHFRARTSRVTADGTMSYAELLLAGRSGDLQTMLEKHGLTATFLKDEPDDPADFNTIVEVCTYLDEQPSDADMGPLDMTIETVYFARILQPKTETRISTGRVRVKKTVRKSNFSSWDVERYLGTLTKAQSSALVTLVDCLGEQLKR